MTRVIFKEKQQTTFLKEVRSVSGLKNEELASLCGVCGHTFRDWVRGKYSISEKALRIFVEDFNVLFPQDIRIVDDFWYVSKGARKGGLKRTELYGSPGTVAGRKKGGTNSQLKRKEDPEKYRLLGSNVRQLFYIEKSSVEFAEATGIVLGDGAISNNQLRISLSSIVDEPYAIFVSHLFEKVFGSRPTYFKRSDCNAIELTISGIGLVEELEKWNFKRGNKIRHQVDFPVWVWQDLEFQKDCVRGLMDTDGGCYFHTHTTNGLTYKNFGMCFTNHSLPIVQSVAKVLKSLGLKFSLVNKKTQIYIYSFEEIKKYFGLIGSNNPKNWRKFNYYLNQKSHRVGCKSG